jgi:hypothetical protein
MQISELLKKAKKYLLAMIKSELISLSNEEASIISYQASADKYEKQTFIYAVENLRLNFLSIGISVFLSIASRLVDKSDISN